VINPDYKIDQKNIINSNSEPADNNTPGLAGSHGSVANPEFINKKMTVTYKMINGSKEGKIIDLELISSGQDQSESGTLMVIVGLYETRDEAINSQKQFLSNYRLETEVLSTNLFQNLEKDHYVVVTGRNLNYDEGQQLMENIKAINVSGFIKDAGTMKLK
jgi:hypothetical protein